MAHSHKGKSSESFLDKNIILGAMQIVPGQTVLDAGCGNGYMAREFARLLEGKGKVIALDVDGEAVAALREETEGSIIEAMEGDMTARTALEDASMDMIYLSTVVHGFPPDKMAGFVAEVKRLLKPRGCLAIMEIQKKEMPFGPPLEKRFTPEELQRVIGLTPLKTVEVGPHFYLQLFENA